MGAHINKLSDRFVTKRNKIYVALEDVRDMDFIWDMKEVFAFEKMWRRKVPLRDIAIELEATEQSVLLLALDRLQRGHIKPRRGWSIW